MPFFTSVALYPDWASQAPGALNCPGQPAVRAFPVRIMIGAGTDGDGDAEAQLCLCAALAIALAVLLPHAPAVLATSAPPRHAGCHHLLPLRPLVAVLDASLKEQQEGEEETKATATALQAELLLLAPLEPEEGAVPLWRSSSRRQVEVGCAMARGGVHAFLSAVGVVTERGSSELSRNFGAWWKLAAVSLFLVGEAWERRWELPGGGIGAGRYAKTAEQCMQDPTAPSVGAPGSASSLEVTSEGQELVTNAEETWPAECLASSFLFQRSRGGWREDSASGGVEGKKTLQACTPAAAAADEVRRKEGKNFDAGECRSRPPRREKYVNCIAATVRLTKSERGMDFDLHDFSGARRHFVPLLVQAAGHQ